MGPPAARYSVRKYLRKLVPGHPPDVQPSPDRDRNAATVSQIATEALVAPANAAWLHLQIRSQIGKGGFGRVFCAWEPKLERLVALKLIPSEDTTGVAEARLLARVRHANLPVVYGVGESEGFTGIWMELIQGRTLAELLRIEGTFSSREAALVGCEVCRALAAAHKAGVIHRDVKAENVIREDGGRITLIDFGLSRDAGRADVNEIAGTAAYLAPEVLNGAPPSRESDMYAVGVMLFHLLTGDFPVKGRNFEDVHKEQAAGHRQSIAQLRPDVDPRFCAIIDLLLSAVPGERPAAGQLVAQLNTHYAAEPAGRINQRFGLRQAALAAVTLLITTGAGVLSREPLHDWLNPLPDREQIVVLSDTTGNTLDDALSDSLADSLSSQLARVEKLDARLLVIPAADLRRDNVATSEDAARRFNANLALMIATDNSAGNTSLHLRLIESNNRRVLRTRRAVLEANEAHLLPARAFELALQMIGVGRSVRTPPGEKSTNPEAYRLTEEGKYLAGRNSPAQLDKAFEVLQRALAADPHYASAYAAVANAYAQKYRYTKIPEMLDLALTNATRALALDKHIAGPYVARARVNSTFGRLDDALADVSVALTLDPEDPEARLIRAECLQKENRTADAEKAYLELIRLRPNYWLAHNRLGALYVQQAKYNEAEKAFEKVTHVMPNSASGYKNLGAVYLAMGRNAEAAAALEKSLSIEQTPEAYTNLGIVYTRQQRLRDAVRSYEKATQLRPSDHRYWRNLGDMLAMLPDRKADAEHAWRTALRLAEQDLSVDAHSVQAAVSCGLYHAKVNDRDQAMRYAVRVDVKDSSDVNVQFKRALVYELTGDRNSALELLRALVKSGFSMGEIEAAPELQDLRQDERFVALSRAADR